MNRRTYLLAAICVVAFVVALVFGLGGPSKGKSRQGQAPGENDFSIMAAPDLSKLRSAAAGGAKQAVPDFSLPNLQGKRVAFSSFQGKVVLLDFWATWCPPCRKEIPLLNELFREFEKDGMMVIGIAVDRDGPEAVRKFVRENKIPYPILLGSKEVVEAFGNVPGVGGPITGSPMLFVIDRHGSVCKRFLGLTGKEVLQREIRKLL
jgi:peroxiredoxin